MLSPNETNSELSLAGENAGPSGNNAMMGEYTRMNRPLRKIAFIHTASPAIPPLMKYYSEAAPDLDIVNLMEDGLLRLLGEGKTTVVEERLLSLATAARDVYRAELAMITCSSVPLATADRIQKQLGLPVIKIDGPMARKAVEAGSKIGVAVTFRPTIEPTTRLIRETAASIGRQIDIQTKVVEGAYDALLAGDLKTHDRLLLDAIRSIGDMGVDSIVLAQVSMARVRDRAQESTSAPVLSSIDTSLSAIRQLLPIPA